MWLTLSSIDNLCWLHAKSITNGLSTNIVYTIECGISVHVQFQTVVWTVSKSVREYMRSQWFYDAIFCSTNKSHGNKRMIQTTIQSDRVRLAYMKCLKKNNFPSEQTDVKMDYRKIISTL